MTPCGLKYGTPCGLKYGTPCGLKYGTPCGLKYGTPCGWKYGTTEIYSRIQGFYTYLFVNPSIYHSIHFISFSLSLDPSLINPLRPEPNDIFIQ